MNSVHCSSWPQPGHPGRGGQAEEAQGRVRGEQQRQEVSERREGARAYRQRNQGRSGRTHRDPRYLEPQDAPWRPPRTRGTHQGRTHCYFYYLTSQASYYLQLLVRFNESDVCFIYCEETKENKVVLARVHMYVIDDCPLPSPTSCMKTKKQKTSCTTSLCDYFTWVLKRPIL